MNEKRSSSLAYASGIMCIAGAYCLLCLVLVTWHINGNYGRQICKVAGPVATILSVLAVGCSVCVIRYRRRAGLAVLGLAAVALVLKLCIPKLQLTRSIGELRFLNPRRWLPDQKPIRR